MGGNDDDRSNDLEKWIEAQRAEISKLRDDLLGQRDKVEKDLRCFTDDPSLSLRSPFERFKNFVDTNITTLSEGFKNFPSNISELKARMQLEREARMNEEKEIWQAWTGSDDSPDHIRMQIDRSTNEEREASRDAVYQLLQQAYRKNQHIPADKIMKLYRDNEWSFGGLDKFANPMLSFGGACYYKPETLENLPSTARWGWPAPAPQWLSVDWFKRSPYSPIRLERYPGLEGEGSKWRAAFEDLLSASLDKPMVSEEKVGIRSLHGKPQSTYYGPGLEWMLSLQCRGILPSQLPGLYKPVSVFDGFDEVKRPRSATFMHDIAHILESKSARMYPMVKEDMEALIDEVSIKSGPETEAAPVRRAWGAAPWRVPETEEELYDEMPPLAKGQYDAWKGAYYYDSLKEAIRSRDLEKAVRLFNQYETEHHEEVGEMIDIVLCEIGDENFSKNYSFAVEALRRSDVSASEQKKADQLLGMRDSALKEQHREGRASFDDDDDDDDDESEVRPGTYEALHQHNSSELSTRPDVLSQLMTTQTTRLPDGTVTTKVVLKQRFADGSEEERETVQTSHEPPSGSAEKKAQDSREQPKKDPKKAGWFWS